MCGIPQVLPLGGPPPCVSQPCTEHTHLPEEGPGAPLSWLGSGLPGLGVRGTVAAGGPAQGLPLPPSSPGPHRPAPCSVPFPPQKPPFQPSPSTEGPSFSSFFLERSPQAIYINMFVTDAKIYTFFCLIKMFKLELAYCLWISRFC